MTCCVSISSQSLHLFSSEIKNTASKTQVVVMDFIERYFSELSTLKDTNIQTKMADDKVFFRKGMLSDLYQIQDTMSFSINLLGDYYEVTWMNAGKEFVRVVFPAQYDLLLGINKNDALRQFKSTILAAPQRIGKENKTPDLIKLNNQIYQSRNDTLEISSLTDALYYNKVNDDFLPVFDKSQIDFSAANLFHGLITESDYQMYVEQSIYGMKTVCYSIALNQWLNYCAEWGLKVYFAVEEEREDGILAIAIALSKELGFHHLLSVVFPNDYICNKNVILKTKITPYIPIHNVKDLYQKQTTNHKTIKWQ